jgi:DNA-binding SARP family transcriptional activator/Tfp pilus assembly protein PilF
MRFGVLGPLLVHDGDALIDIQAPRQRTVLAALLVQAGRAVPAEKLAEALWGEGPPAAAAVTLRTHVMRLRKVLGLKAAARVLTRSGCYQLDASEDEVDHLLFAALCSRGGAAAEAGAWRQADRVLSNALGLWRGAPLADIPSESMRSEAAPHLEQLHLQALEWRNDARLSLGQHSELLIELQALAAENPLRERFHAQLMLSLYRCGRQADALAAFQHARRLIVEELGIEPGPELRDLHQRILTADRSLDVCHPAAALAARTDAVPHQLPAAVRNFTGRQREMEAMTAALHLADSEPARRTLVISAVSGTAGVGKTALAVQWAQQLADRFPDGQLYVNLRGYDPGPPVLPADALAGFLLALGTPGPDIPPGLDERAAQYRSMLSGRRVMVVLDNAREAEQVRLLLPGTSSCVAVVTSRDSLAGLVARDGAWRVDLDVLPPEDAVSLLRALVGERVQAEPREAATLAAQCCRLPLALRIAAELAATYRDVSLADLTSDLADQQQRLDLLDASGDALAAPRAVFSWSYRNLNAAAARAFRRVGQHPGASFDTHAVAALAGVTLKQARQMLNSLARAYLVQPPGLGRYSMHDLLRAYACELANAEDSPRERQAALTRLLDYYLHAAATAMDTIYPAERGQRPCVARSAVPAPDAARDHGAARAWLDAERANLVAAATLAVGHNWPGHATRLAATLHRYLDKGGYYAEARVIHDSARRAARSTAHRADEANALVNLAIVDGHQGRYQQATDRLREALTLFGDIGDEIGEARVLGNLGVIEFYQGRYAEADRHLSMALALHRQAGDLVNEARMLGNLGTLNIRYGHYEQAKEYLDQALGICEQTGNLTGKAHILGALGETALRSGQHRRAASHLQHALGLSRQAGDRAEQARILCDLGLSELRQGRAGQASTYLGQALDLSTEIGERSVTAQAHIGLGEVRLAAGRPDMARRAYADALELAGQIRDRLEHARANDGLGCAHHAEGDHVRARRHWQAALDIYAELGVPEADQLRRRLAADVTSGGRSQDGGQPQDGHQDARGCHILPAD